MEPILFFVSLVVVGPVLIFSVFLFVDQMRIRKYAPYLLHYIPQDLGDHTLESRLDTACRATTEWIKGHENDDLAKTYLQDIQRGMAEVTRDQLDRIVARKYILMRAVRRANRKGSR
ncbi:MAG: hypothetical protein JST40_04240 [Armatimonadetes bacterium]|nr:hypothetical protein [Armatimonadota bacterium]